MARLDTATLHLKTQNGQPYGSERRCCEICGVMLWGQPDEPAWTDDARVYGASPLRCSLRLQIRSSA